MWEFFKQVLSSDFGSFGFVVSIMVLIIWLSIQAGKIIEKYNLINKLERGLETIKDDIAIIKAHIEVNKRGNNDYAESLSPIGLNAKGKEISEKLKAKQAINTVWDKIRTDIVADFIVFEKDSKNPYTIQEICFSIGQAYSKYLDPNDMEHIKRVAFEEGVLLAAFDLLFGIEIRNRYFEEEKMLVQDIDQHDPQKKSS